MPVERGLSRVLSRDRPFAGVAETRLNVIARQAGVVAKDVLRRPPLSQEFNDELYRKARPLHDWLSAENFRIKDNSLLPAHALSTFCLTPSPRRRRARTRWCGPCRPR